MSEAFDSAQISFGKVSMGGNREISVMAIPVIWEGETVAVLVSEKTLIGEILPHCASKISIIIGQLPVIGGMAESSTSPQDCAWHR